MTECKTLLVSMRRYLIPPQSGGNFSSSGEPCKPWFLRHAGHRGTRITDFPLLVAGPLGVFLDSALGMRRNKLILRHVTGQVLLTSDFAKSGQGLVAQ